MYSLGHQIPGVRSTGNGYSRRQAAPYARPATPPPPPGAPPPPPPGVTN
jgi:hypothetical protein